MAANFATAVDSPILLGDFFPLDLRRATDQRCSAKFNYLLHYQEIQ
jgi:hypothetical protein